MILEKIKENKMNEFVDKLSETIIARTEEVEAEVIRQLKLWGTEFDDKNTANDWVAYILYYLAQASYAGRKELYSPQKFQESLKKAASLCISAIVAVDRNGDCAPRHYEKLPNSGATTDK